MVSFGNLMGYCGGRPGVYVNVPHYRKWIDDRTNNGGRLTTFDKSFHNALLTLNDAVRRMSIISHMVMLWSQKILTLSINN